MQNRRETLKQSAVVAGLLASAGFPQFAHAAFNKVAFDAKGDIKNGALTLYTFNAGKRSAIAVVR